MKGFRQNSARGALPRLPTSSASGAPRRPREADAGDARSESREARDARARSVPRARSASRPSASGASGYNSQPLAAQSAVQAMPKASHRPLPRPSAQGMAYARGAQAMRLKEKQAKLISDPADARLFVLELLVRTACTVLESALREVCAIRAASRQLRDTCTEDGVWEQLFRARWAVPQAAPSGGWRQAFLARLARGQAHFLARALPSLLRRARRRDGFPDLRRVHDALRMRYSLTLSGASSKHPHHLDFSADACQQFDTALCLRCTFSMLRLQCPLHFRFLGRSSAVGRQEVLLSLSLQNLEDWSVAEASGEHCRFLRSPCGRLLVAMWQSDGALAGLYANFHYMQVLRPMTGPGEAWDMLSGRPAPDDLDSALGLHDYTLLLTLRSAKLACFSNAFYKVHLFGLGSKPAFGGAVVDARHCVEQRTLPQDPAKRPASRKGKVQHALQAEVGHFEVLAPHYSGAQPPFPCLRQPQIAFQTAAFKSILLDHTFMDVTAFDEHGHVFWFASAACQLSDVCPHESSMLQDRFVQVDFDRGGASSGQEVRWLCLADRGAAQLLLQLEYGAGLAAGEKQPPRLNTVTWHPELEFLDEWWGSKYFPLNKRGRNP
ncbi:unnamed protein product [Effrenium voratum]|nr:unnamed protein product [Effrenium voratum]